MALIPFAVLWLAYQCGWYGFCTIKPVCGVGFTDLILPGKMAKVDGYLQAAAGDKQDMSLCDKSPLSSVAPGGDVCAGNTCVGGGQVFGGNSTNNAPQTATQPPQQAQLIPNVPTETGGSNARFV